MAVSNSEMIDRIVVTLDDMGSPQLLADLVEKMVESYDDDEFYRTAILSLQKNPPEYYRIYESSDMNYVELTVKGRERANDIQTHAARGVSADKPLVFSGQAHDSREAADWTKFPDYVSELLTRYRMDENTSEWPRMEHLVLLVKNGTRYSAASNEMIEQKIRELSGSSSTAIIEPIEDDQTVILKKLAKLDHYPLPRSIQNEMRESLKPGSPLRLSQLYEAIKIQIAPQPSEADEPSFRRALLNKIAKCVDGVRFEFVIDPANPDVARIRKTNEFLAKELEASSPGDA